jgi:outer membrane protein assembly factor BamD (BamD/ComL family)
MAAGASERALETLQRYLSKYPTGSFRPEATALKIETLVRMGRTKEARALADRFVADHRGSPLARRVSELTRVVER